MGRRIVVDRQAHLPEVVGTLHPPGGFAGRLNGGQQQGDQNPDDRNDHEKLDEGENRGLRAAMFDAASHDSYFTLTPIIARRTLRRHPSPSGTP